ncbi:hypothetical protein N657DRAFT_670842 [Parathielavia appendiculata]|uniref:Uncharacterized protein n=1 Tax=Parathielavia appendiculata TaxID=2587402 RepID=A0AAN6U2Y0_9PEZI|nr:hypothetical protein N657DRAFT_670842 [Parathielavia appendiculata]
MKLTPIKVKGKGSQKNPWKPPSLTHVAKRKRDDDEKCDNRGYELRRMRFKSKKPAAPIEELPTEILERIILMSRNLNFLRSSLRIGYRFSSATFLTELLEAAFAPTWDIRYGLSIPTSTMLDMPGGHWTIPEFLIPGDPDFQWWDTKLMFRELQSAVLAGKWANTTNILEAQKKWYRRRGGPRRLHEHLEPSHHLPIAQHSVAAPNGATDATDVVVIFERDWETFKRGCAHLLSKDRGLTASCDIHATGSLAKAEYLDLHPSITIPQRLLAGPFDWETARTCFWLVHGGAHLSSVHMWSWEVRFISSPF